MEPVPESLYKSRYPTKYPEALAGSVWNQSLYREVVQKLNFIMSQTEVKGFWGMICASVFYCHSAAVWDNSTEECDQFLNYINARPDVVQVGASLTIRHQQVRYQNGMFFLPCLIFGLGLQ